MIAYLVLSYKALGALVGGLILIFGLHCVYSLKFQNKLAVMVNSLTFLLPKNINVNPLEV